MARLKMTGSTPNSSTSPCTSCRFLKRVRGQRDEFRFCDKFDRQLNMQVSECSEYQNKNHPSLFNMQQIAWNLTADKKGGRAGFLSPEQLNRLVEEGKVDRPNWLEDE